MLVEENPLLAYDSTKFKLLRHNIRDNGVFRSRERNFFRDSGKFESTGFICVLYYKGKRGEIGFVRDSEKFEITVYEITDFICVLAI